MGENSTRKTLSKAWESPTLMTWLNLGSKMVSLLVLFPLILRNFNEADSSLYLLMISAITIQSLLAGGLVATFSRYVTYGLAGARIEDLRKARINERGFKKSKMSAKFMRQIRGTMRRVFLLCGILSLLAFGPFGTWLLWKPVSHSTDFAQSWVAWGIILMVSPLHLYGMRFNTMLQGVDKVALEQRWSALFSILASVSSIVAIVVMPNFLLIIGINQFWLLVGYLRNRYLERLSLVEIEVGLDNGHFSSDLFRVVWSTAWKSMMGIFLMNVLMHISGFVYAQRFDSVVLASYLVGLRLITAVSQFCRAPFYSKIPRLNALRGTGKIEELKTLAYRSMTFSLALYLVIAIGVGIFGPILLNLIKSNSKFPDVRLWIMLVITFLLERFGAMHLQVYTTTNHVIWHRATFVSGTIALVLTLLLLPNVGVYAFPIAMTIGLMSYYSTVVPAKSIRSLNYAS